MYHFCTPPVLASRARPRSFWPGRPRAAQPQRPPPERLDFAVGLVDAQGGAIALDPDDVREVRRRHKLRHGHSQPLQLPFKFASAASILVELSTARVHVGLSASERGIFDASAGGGAMMMAAPMAGGAAPVPEVVDEGNQRQVELVRGAPIHIVAARARAHRRRGEQQRDR